jgi:hypothetical protein
MSYWNPKQKEQLEKGLSFLPNLLARICPVCNGHGEYEQTYNAGCGMGLYQVTGPCSYCEGGGLLQGNLPAPSSVRNQVIVAGERHEQLPSPSCH